MKRLASLLFSLTAVVLVSAHDYRLWYDRPAMTWTQALPVGNGVIGGMVFGTPAVERIQLNEETLWAGQPNQVVNPNAKEALPEVRRLIFEGKYKEAQQLANEKVMPNAVGQNMGMPYQPFGDLYIAMPYLQRIYGFYNAKDNVRNVHLTSERHDFGPNKRQAVYDFFIDVFGLDRSMLDESKIEIEPDDALKSLYK